MEVVLAGSEYFDEVVVLFDQYRVFYKQSSDIESVRHFLQERFQSNDSTIFIARENGCGVGFTQLYPSFSSVSMKRIWILNDLFVKKSHRKQGAAKLLMGAAENYARQTGAAKIILATQITNIAAQTLYESLGYSRNQEFQHYALRL